MRRLSHSIPTLSCLLGLTCCLFGVPTSVSAEIIAEGFDNNVNQSIILGRSSSSGSEETIVRPSARRYAWGAYCQPGCQSRWDKWISLTHVGANTCLAFDNGSFVTGNYVYTRFNADESDGNNNVPTRPSGRSEPLDFSIGGGGLQIKVPTIKYWKVLKITLNRETGI